MIEHDGIFEWDGKNRPGEKPMCWWPGSYRLRIVDLASDDPHMFYIKSKAVLLRNRGTGTSIRNCIQAFVKKISTDFKLDIPKVLWAEVEADGTDEIMVANIAKVRALGGDELFSVTWRKARPNEAELLEPFIDGLEKDPPPDEKSPA